MNAHAAHVARARHLIQIEKYNLAVAELHGALAVEPNSAEAQALLGNCFLELGRLSEADEATRSAIGLAPDWAYPHFVQSRIRAEQGKYRLAMEAILEALRLEPEDADYHCFRAVLLHDGDNFEPALAGADYGLQCDPRHVGCANLRVLCLNRLGRFSEADAEINRILAIDPEFAWTHENKGWSSLRKGDAVEALARFRDALRLNPHNLNARRGMLEALAAQNRFYRGLFWFFEGKQALPMAWAVRGALFSLAVGLVVAVFAGDRNGEYFLLSTFVTFLVYAACLTLLHYFGGMIFLCLQRFTSQAGTTLTRDERRHADVVASCVLLAVVLVAAAWYGERVEPVLLALGFLFVAALSSFWFSERTRENFRQINWRGLAVYIGVMIALATVAWFLLPLLPGAWSRILHVFVFISVSLGIAIRRKRAAERAALPQRDSSHAATSSQL